MTALGSLVTINPREPRPKGDIGVITLTDVDTVSATVAPAALTVKRDPGSFRRIAHEGDVLLARISPSLQNGKVAIVPALPNGAAFVSGELLVLRPRRGVDPRMIWALLRRDALRRQLGELTVGSSGYRRIDPSLVEAIDLPELTPRAWRLASEILLRLDEAITVRRDSLERLRELPDAVIGAAATGVSEVELGSLKGNFRSGFPRRLARTGQRPVVRSANLRDGSIAMGESRYLPAQAEAPDLRPGDLLIVRLSGSPEIPGKCAVFDGHPVDASFPSYMVRLRDSALDPDLLWAWLQTPRAKTALALRGRARNGRYSLRIAELKSLPVPRFTPETRGQLTRFARLLRRLLAASNQHLDLLEETVQAHLDHTFADAAVSPSPLSASTAIPAISASSIPAGLERIYDAATERQKRIWRGAVGHGEQFRVAELEPSDPDRASVRHTLSILEQLGVLIREREGVIESWRVPDEDDEEAP